MSAEHPAAQTQGTKVGREQHTLGTTGLTAGAEHVKSAATERERLRWEMHKVAWRIAHEPKRPCVNRKEKS